MTTTRDRLDENRRSSEWCGERVGLVSEGSAARLRKAVAVPDCLGFGLRRGAGMCLLKAAREAARDGGLLVAHGGARGVPPRSADGRRAGPAAVGVLVILDCRRFSRFRGGARPRGSRGHGCRCRGGFPATASAAPTRWARYCTPSQQWAMDGPTLSGVPCWDKRRPFARQCGRARRRTSQWDDLRRGSGGQRACAYERPGRHDGGPPWPEYRTRRDAPRMALARPSHRGRAISERGASVLDFPSALGCHCFGVGQWMALEGVLNLVCFRCISGVAAV